MLSSLSRRSVVWTLSLCGMVMTLGRPRGEGSEAATPDSAAIHREQIEADWLRQDLVRGIAADRHTLTTQEDAAGGCDGVKDGRWGFHTRRENDPWWQVDLGRVLPLDQVFIYNRCDACSERAARLAVLLSPDGQEWTEVYRHDGSVFRGLPDGRPLTVDLQGAQTRFVRVQLPGLNVLHLDEVEVFPTTNHRDVALGRTADQSSVSSWSTPRRMAVSQAAECPTPTIVARGLALADNLRAMGADVTTPAAILNKVARLLNDASGELTAESKRTLYFQARWAVRRLALANPLLNFDRLLFVKRVPTSFTHMSDQNYGWFSRPGGGLFILEDFKSDTPQLRCLTTALPPGNILRPDISYDGTRVLFAYCKYYPNLAKEPNKLDKSKIPEDAFYHIYEMNLDGTGLRRLTRGKYDDFDGHYLPNDEIVFLSTRRGQFIQCGRASAGKSLAADLPDCYVRCGGGPERPVAIYTLHVMNSDGHDLRAISAFESFEWTPSVAPDGRILYARWDYVDRDAMPYISLWSTLPDGTETQAIYGNYTVNPYCIFEACSIPNSRKLVFTASAHHSVTGGSLVILDPEKGTDGPAPLTRLTPEVPFPEVEAWPTTYYVNPYPLSEDHYLTAWSDQPLATGWPRENPANALGLYLYDTFGNLNLIYRDLKISSMYPMPIRPRRRPLQPASVATGVERSTEGRLLLLNVHKGLYGADRERITRLRLVGVPPKTHPTMNRPKLGVTGHDPGKFVLGTVPVEADGSAYFRVPAGVSFFIQALDADGMAVQSMRTAIYVQPGQTTTCVGCHASHTHAPPNHASFAALRLASTVSPGPEGSWPLDFDRLIQPILETHCVRCHRPDADGAKFHLTADAAYETLTTFGGASSLRTHVRTRHRQGYSTAGACAAQSSPLTKLLKNNHYETSLSANDWERLITWMDTYAQRTGSFSPDQQQRLEHLRQRMAQLLTSSARGKSPSVP